MVPRVIEQSLRRLAALYPVVTVTGPRQSDNLARRFRDRYPYDIHVKWVTTAGRDYV
jgi:hypothetical protein